MTATPHPRLEMLWENTDAAAALTTRFGFRDALHAAAWVGDALDEGWDIHLDGCDRLVISASKLLAWLTVDGRRLIAKIAVDPQLFARLAEVDALTTWLQGRSIPVAASIATDAGQPRWEHEGYSVGLYPVVRGELLDATDSSQVQAAGRMLALLHRALREYPEPIAGAPASVGLQLVHGDFRSANILYHGGISAVLDFDEACYRSRAADLARAAVLLATRYHDWQPTSAATRALFVAAYEEVAPLSGTDRGEFDRVTTAVNARFGWA